MQRLPDNCLDSVRDPTIICTQTRVPRARRGTNAVPRVTTSPRTPRRYPAVPSRSIPTVLVARSLDAPANTGRDPQTLDDRIYFASSSEVRPATESAIYATLPPPHRRTWVIAGLQTITPMTALNPASHISGIWDPSISVHLRGFTMTSDLGMTRLHVWR